MLEEFSKVLQDLPGMPEILGYISPYINCSLPSTCTFVTFLTIVTKFPTEKLKGNRFHLGS